MSSLPEGWVLTTIGGVCDIRTGKTPPTADLDNFSGDVPFFKPGDLEGSDNLAKSEYSISRKGAELAGYLPKDTVLVSCIGNLGKVGILAAPGSCNQQINAILPSPKVEPRFVLYWARRLRPWLEENSSATTISIINKGRFEKAPLPLPPIGEQLRIVAKLDSLLDRSRNTREELEHIPKLVARYKQTTLTRAFRGELTASWRADRPDLRIAARSGSNAQSARRRKRLQSDPSDFEPPFEIPEQWQWIELPTLGILDRGRSRHRPRNHPSLYGGPYPFIQTGDVKAARGRLTSFSQTYSEAGLAQSRVWPRGTLCITIAANIAETAILDIDACFPDSIVGFTANAAFCNARFIEFFIRTIRDDLAAFAPATAQKNINLELLSQDATQQAGKPASEFMGDFRRISDLSTAT
jgi:type I restriction enzyme S subunit